MNNPQQPPQKKFTSKWFRVATEGATSDGRNIERAWIEQMAKSYNPKKYGARVWLEHMRGMFPDSSFRAYGDVLAVKAEEVEDNKLALFAQISPTQDLVELNKRRQKIYTSIEVNYKFADTGEAYLVGLAVTDSPASLGTEVLEFARKNPAVSPFASRKSSADCVFSEAVPVELEFLEETESASLADSIVDRVKALLSPFSGQVKQGSDADKQFAEACKAIEAVTAHISDLEQRFAKSQQDIANLATLADQVRALTAFREKLEQQDDTQPERPPATGGSAQVLTDI